MLIGGHHFVKSKGLRTREEEITEETGSHPQSPPCDVFLNHNNVL